MNINCQIFSILLWAQNRIEVSFSFHAFQKLNPQFGGSDIIIIIMEPEDTLKRETETLLLSPVHAAAPRSGLNMLVMMSQN